MRQIAPNLTPDGETGIGRCTDGQLIRAIREGIGHVGRPLTTAMPWPYLSAMTETDVTVVDGCAARCRRRSKENGMRWRWLLGLGLVIALVTGLRAQPRGDYLLVWAGDVDHKDSDFIATIDLAEHRNGFGRIVATTQVNERGLFPHHTEHELSPFRTLFANGFGSDRSFLWDVADPRHPKVLNRWSGAGDLSFIHSFVRLANGHAIATAQGHGPQDLSPGGLVELDEHGRVVRTGSSADATGDLPTLRPYSLAVVPALDRVVVGLTFMPIPSWHANGPMTEHEHTGSQIQVFRLSTLSLIRTIKVDDGVGPNEPRLLADGRTVIVSSTACRFYVMRKLESEQPRAELAYMSKEQGCANAVVIGSQWVQAAARSKAVFALDVSDPSRVRLLSELRFTGERDGPHWLATDGHRVIIVNVPAAEPRIKMATLTDGQLALDERFRDEDSSTPGLTFERESWPHGQTGPAIPHGTVFTR